MAAIVFILGGIGRQQGGALVGVIGRGRHIGARMGNMAIEMGRSNKG